MRRERSLDSLFARDLDRLPLPEPELWLPPSRRRRSRPLSIATAIIAAVVLGAIAGLGLQEVRSSKVPAAATAAPTGSPAAGASWIHVNSRFNYSIALPTQWRRSEAERIVPSDVGRLGSREIFTARTPQEEARFVGSQPLPWNLFIEVWDRAGQSAEDYLRTWWRCAEGCVTATTLKGARVLVGVMGPPLVGRVYVIERGERFLVLRYGIGDESNRPRDVTEETLQRIISSLELR